MADARTEYQDALDEFEKAEAAAKQATNLIEAFSSALRRDLGSFIARHCGVILHDQMPSGARFTSGSELDFDRWPDLTTLRSVLAKWATSHQKRMAAYKAMTPAEQRGFSEPPKVLRL